MSMQGSHFPSLILTMVLLTSLKLGRSAGASAQQRVIRSIRRRSASVTVGADGRYGGVVCCITRSTISEDVTDTEKHKCVHVRATSRRRYFLRKSIRSERLTFWRQVLAGVGLAAEEDLVQDDAEAVDVACLAAATAA